MVNPRRSQRKDETGKGNDSFDPNSAPSRSRRRIRRQVERSLQSQHDSTIVDVKDHSDSQVPAVSDRSKDQWQTASGPVGNNQFGFPLTDFRYPQGSSRAQRDVVMSPEFQPGRTTHPAVEGHSSDQVHGEFSSKSGTFARKLARYDRSKLLSGASHGSTSPNIPASQSQSLNLKSTSSTQGSPSIFSEEGTQGSNHAVAESFGYSRPSVEPHAAHHRPESSLADNWSIRRRAEKHTSESDEDLLLAYGYDEPLGTTSSKPSKSYIDRSDVALLGSVLDMNTGAFELKVLVEGKAIKYITTDPGAYSPLYIYWIANIMQELPLLPSGDWNIGHIGGKALPSGRSTFRKTRTVNLPSILSPWPEKYTTVDFWKTEHELFRHSIWEVRDPMYRASGKMIAKICDFPRDIESFQNETNVYHDLGQWGIMPALYGHVQEDGRTIGLLLEHVKGHLPRYGDKGDAAACLKALKTLHGCCYIHGNVQRHHFIVNGNRAWLIDLRLARRCDDPSQWAHEQSQLQRALEYPHYDRDGFKRPSMQSSANFEKVMQSLMENLELDTDQLEIDDSNVESDSVHSASVALQSSIASQKTSVETQGNLGTRYLDEISAREEIPQIPGKRPTILYEELIGEIEWDLLA